MGMSSTGRLKFAFGITLLVLVGEVAGGLLSNSLALLSDAGHVFTDSFALGLSLLAARISERPIDQRATYGYHRVGLLAAVINGVSLIFIAGYIFYESYERFVSPQAIDLSVMLPVAVAGFAANILMAAVLGGGHKDLNVRSAWLHVVGDTLSSLGVIVSGIIVYLTGWLYADPIAGVLIAVIIVSGGLRVVREAVSIFLDLAPSGYDVVELSEQIRAIKDVQGIHDVHIRAVTRGRVYFSAHVWVGDRMLSEVEHIRREIEELLGAKGINHVMLQFECVECDTDGLYCRACSAKTEEHGHHH